MNKVLAQDEVDALLRGLSGGDIESEMDMPDEDADGDGKLDIASLTYDGESTLPTFTNETTSDEPPAPDPNQPGTDEPAEPTTPGVPDTGDHTVSALPAVLALGGVALVGGALAVARRRVR